MRSVTIEVLGVRVVGEEAEHIVELSLGDGRSWNSSGPPLS